MVLVSRVKVKNGNIKEAVWKAISLVSKFPVKGKKVLIKPNVNSDDPYPGTTNPAVVRAIADLCFEKGAKKVIVGDHSSVFWPRTRHNMKANGLLDAMKGSKAEIVDFIRYQPVEVNGECVDKIRVAKEMYEDYYKINVPVCHTHSMAVFSMSMKNLMGVMHRIDRLKFHTSRLQMKIAELNKVVKTDLNVMDGTVIMYDCGPAKGPSVKKDLIFASEDRVALDYVGCREIQACGGLKEIDVWNLPQLKHAREIGVGVKNLKSIVVKNA